jgi:hypothetical protein
VRTWLDAAERLMTTKYGVTPAAYRISVYLHAGPTSNATVNQALNRCCTTGESRVHTGTIDILAPSAPAWKVANPRSSLGMPKADDNYHVKVLMSEYITIGHYAVQDGRPAGGWKYTETPQWFVQDYRSTTGFFIPPSPIVTRRPGGAALANVTSPDSLEELFRQFQKWLRGRAEVSQLRASRTIMPRSRWRRRPDIFAATYEPVE